MKPAHAEVLTMKANVTRIMRVVKKCFTFYDSKRNKKQVEPGEIMNKKCKIWLRLRYCWALAAARASWHVDGSKLIRFIISVKSSSFDAVILEVFRFEVGEEIKLTQLWWRNSEEGCKNKIRIKSEAYLQLIKKKLSSESTRSTLCTCHFLFNA